MYRPNLSSVPKHEPRLPTSRGGRAAFTIIELIVSVAVIGILIALLLPAVQGARSQARSTQCLSNLKQIGLALHHYESIHEVFPPSFVRQEDDKFYPKLMEVPHYKLLYRSHWTGFHLLLPFINHKDLHRRIDFNGSWLSDLRDPYDTRIWQINRTVLPELLCPSAARSEFQVGGEAPTEDYLHFMGGSPSDYSFCHGADNINPLPEDYRGSGPKLTEGGIQVAGESTVSNDEKCPGGIRHYWSEYPTPRRGAFGFNSNCRFKDIDDGMSWTILLGEKTGAMLSYKRSGLPFGRLKVEYPWAMAAVTWYAATGQESVPQSAWVAAPYAVTRDLRPPSCPTDSAGAGVPYPMNPSPVWLPPNADERSIYSFQSAHPGGAFFAFADGSTRFLGESIDQKVFENISTIAGGEDIPEEQIR